MLRILMESQKSIVENRPNSGQRGDVMLIRGLVFLSVAGLLLVACGDKEDDTGADAVQATDTADDDSAVE